MTETITEALEDIISHHIFIDDIIILILAFLIFYLYFKKKIKFSYALIFDLCLLSLEIVAILNGARILEWAGWYVKNEALINKFYLEMYLEEIIGGIVLVLIVAMTILKRKRIRQNKQGFTE